MTTRELFEKWVVTQFGEDKRPLLTTEDDGSYKDEHINAMWIGFNAHKELTADKPKPAKAEGKDPFHAEKRAIKFCETYGYERGTKDYEIATSAYSVGYKNGVENL